MVIVTAIGALVGVALLAALFVPLERRFAAIPVRRGSRTGRRIDIGLFVLNQTVTSVVSGVVAGTAAIGVALLAGIMLTLDHITGVTPYETPVTSLPMPAQVALFLVVADFSGYWAHRALHARPRLWRIHSIHHSSRQLDWLSALRVHPLNDVITAIALGVPVLLLGFRPAAFGAYILFIGLYAVLLHANLPWSFGWLRYVVASPVFHRWHHTTEREGLDKNFAGLLPLWDILFGTLHLPRNRQPMVFGILGEAPPERFWGQLLHPLRPGRQLVG